VNTDDPGIMCTNLLNEYALLTTECGIDLATLEACNAWALEASFIPTTKKEAAWNQRLKP
jgi:adenosine deaminase